MKTYKYRNPKAAVVFPTGFQERAFFHLYPVLPGMSFGFMYPQFLICMYGKIIVFHTKREILTGAGL
jgi:hypothetical protein